MPILGFGEGCARQNLVRYAVLPALPLSKQTFALTTCAQWQVAFLDPACLSAILAMAKL